MDSKRTLIFLWGSFLLLILGVFAGYALAFVWRGQLSLPTFSLFNRTKISSDYSVLKYSHFGAGSGEDLDLVKELGAHWIRFPMDIDSLGADPNKIDFTDLDRRVKQAQEKNILLFGSFNRGGRHSPQYWPDAKLFAKYFASVVERYDGDGVDDMPGLTYPIKYWEILNEAPASPNQDLVPQIYAYYLKESIEALHNACSDCLLAPGGIPGPIGQEFLQDTLALDRSLSPALDFSVWHVYSAPFDGASGLIKLTNWLKTWGFGNKEVWYTELAADNPADIVKTFTYHFAHGAKVEIFSEFYSSKNAGLLVTAKGEKTPSFVAYQTMIKNLDYFSSVKIIKENWAGSSANWVLQSGQYEFAVNGKAVYVLWGSGSLPNEISGQVTVINIDGTLVTKDASNITLNSEPIFVAID